MMFESHEFYLSMQSLDPISRNTQQRIINLLRNTSFCKDIYRKDKAGKTWCSHSHLERSRRGRTVVHHLIILRPWTSKLTSLHFYLIIHKKSPMLPTSKMAQKASLSPFIEHSPSRVSFHWLFLTGQVIVFN